MIDARRREVPGTKIVLMAASAARDYYPRIGFTRRDSAWALDAQKAHYRL
jgi:hypothetical protein